MENKSKSKTDRCGVIILQGSCLVMRSSFKTDVANSGTSLQERCESIAELAFDLA